MAQKSAEVKSCIPGAHSLAEARDRHYAGGQEQVRALAGCSLCSNDSCLAKGLLACTSLKGVCTTLRVWALGLAGRSTAAGNSWFPIPRRTEEKSFQAARVSRRGGDGTHAELEEAAGLLTSFLQTS